MAPELAGAIVGGIIGICGVLLPTIISYFIDKKRRRDTIVRIIAAELTAIKEKAERFIEGKSNIGELRSSIPLWSSSLALELGFISVNQAVNTRRAIVLDMEMRETGRLEKAKNASKRVN